MNGIVLCVFQEDLKSVFVLLESLFIYGNLVDTEILIYTTSRLRDRLRQSHLYHESIVFEIKEEFTGNERFELSVVSKYDTVLYLDTHGGCVVKEDLMPIFENVQKDVLYVLEEDGIHYFTSHLGDNIHFICPLLLFKPGHVIESLFTKMKICQDMRYTVCSTSVYKQLDHFLGKFAANGHGQNIYSEYIIHYGTSIPSFLNEKKEATIQLHIQEAKLFVLKHLLPIIHNSGELLEGNIFMTHHTTQFTDLFLDKQRNISNLVLNTRVKNVMEIGFNAGFSSLLMLLSNPWIKLTCFDLGEHRYTRPCYEKLRQHFGPRIQLILGDSTQTLKKVTDTFDLIHIDGGHATDVATSDIVQSYRLSKPGTILIMDDYDFPNLHQLWDGYIQKYNLKPLDIRVYPSPHHDVKFV